MGRAHGDQIAYAGLWAHRERRVLDRIPDHQQAGWVNAGVVLLRPDARTFAQMMRELQDEDHPEHYATYMPEQEYLGRFYGTFGAWAHVSCRFNFEVDKRERIACDWPEEGNAICDKGSAPGAKDLHPGVVVFHFS